MRKKRQQRRDDRGGSAPRATEKPAPTALGEALARTLAARAPAATAQPAAPQPPAKAPAQRPAPAPAPREQLTPEQLMERAFGAVERGAIYAGKYEGRGFDARDVEIVKPAPAEVLVEEPAPSSSATPDDLLFAEVMGGHVRLMADRDRYADVRGHDWVGARWADAAELATLTPEQLLQPDMTGAQRELLRLSRKAGAPLATLNLRLERLAAAMGELEVFVRERGAAGDRFVRVITGKGRNSSEGPVIKPAVLRWCEGDGAPFVKRWAPETDRSGNFGAVVLELDVLAFRPRG